MTCALRLTHTRTKKVAKTRRRTSQKERREQGVRDLQLKLKNGCVFALLLLIRGVSKKKVIIGVLERSGVQTQPAHVTDLAVIITLSLIIGVRTAYSGCLFCVLLLVAAACCCLLVLPLSKYFRLESGVKSLREQQAAFYF